MRIRFYYIATILYLYNYTNTCMFVSALPDPTSNSEISANGGNKQILYCIVLYCIIGIAIFFNQITCIMVSRKVTIRKCKMLYFRNERRYGTGNLKKYISRSSSTSYR